MDGPGTITWEEFVEGAEQLVKSSDELSDHWQFLGDKESPGQAYLLRQEKLFVPSDYPIDESSSDNEDKGNRRSDEEWDENPDVCADQFEATCAQERPLFLEHHVLWSISYGVPVIYFNGWKSDFLGINPVSVQVAQKLLKNDKLAYSELSQAIHPILGRPFLHLHPCGSHQLLLNTTKSANKLISWLSAVAPAALNLKLRPEYMELTRPVNGEGKEASDE